MLEQQRQPFGVFQAGGFGLGGELGEAFGHAVEAKGVQQIDGGMGKHVVILQWK